MATLGNSAIIKIGSEAIARVITIGGLNRSVAEVPVPTLGTVGFIPKLYSPQIQHDTFEVTAYTIFTDTDQTGEPDLADSWFATLGTELVISVTAGGNTWSAQAVIQAHNPGDFVADEPVVATFTISLTGLQADGATPIESYPTIAS